MANWLSGFVNPCILIFGSEADQPADWSTVLLTGTVQYGTVKYSTVQYSTVHYVPADWLWLNHRTWITGNWLADWLTDLVTYLLTPRSTVLLVKLTNSQLVNKFFAFYGTRKFITAFTSVRHLSLSWARSNQSMPPQSHFLNIHLNIFLPSTSVSSKWPLYLRFPHQNPLYASALPQIFSSAPYSQTPSANVPPSM